MKKRDRRIFETLDLLTLLQDGYVIQDNGYGYGEDWVDSDEGDDECELIYGKIRERISSDEYEFLLDPEMNEITLARAFQEITNLPNVIIRQCFINGEVGFWYMLSDNQKGLACEVVIKYVATGAEICTGNSPYH